MKSSLKIVLAVILGLVLLTLFFRSCSGDNPPSSNDSGNSNESSQQQSNSSETKLTEIRNISFGGNYDEAIFIPARRYYIFVGATTPYCVINGNGNEFCGEKNEDISDQMGDTPSNKKIRVKSQNGNQGSVTIEIYTQ